MRMATFLRRSLTSTETLLPPECRPCPMSCPTTEAKNGETLRAFWGQWPDEGWTIEEWRHGEADLSLLDPEVVYEDNNLPDHIGDTYRGPEGVIRAAERWTEPFESLAVGLERIID